MNQGAFRSRASSSGPSVAWRTEPRARPGEPPAHCTPQRLTRPKRDAVARRDEPDVGALFLGRKRDSSTGRVTTSVAMMSGMAERAVIEASDAPWTRSSIATDLRRLGVTPGGALLGHTAVSRLGWVCGGLVAVAQALLDVMRPQGTLVVPTHTTGNCATANRAAAAPACRSLASVWALALATLASTCERTTRQLVALLRQDLRSSGCASCAALAPSTGARDRSCERGLKCGRVTTTMRALRRFRTRGCWWQQSLHHNFWSERTSSPPCVRGWPPWATSVRVASRS